MVRSGNFTQVSQGNWPPVKFLESRLNFHVKVGPFLGERIIFGVQSVWCWVSNRFGAGPISGRLLQMASGPELGSKLSRSKLSRARIRCRRKPFHACDSSPTQEYARSQNR